MLKNFLIAFTVLMSLDYLWLGIVMQGYYAQLLKPISQSDENQLVHNWPALLFIYLLLAAGLAFFVLAKPNVRLPQAGLRGALFGLIVYGVYNLSNYATLHGWPAAFFCLDLPWGMFICAMASMVSAFFSKQNA